MSQHERRRGFSAPQRSPRELAERLAELAAATDEPHPRPRRPIPPPGNTVNDIAWSIPAEPRDAVIAEPAADTGVPTADDPLREHAAPPAGEPTIPPEDRVEPPVEPEAPVEPMVSEEPVEPTVPEAPAKPRDPEAGETRPSGLVVGSPLSGGRAALADQPAVAAEPALGAEPEAPGAQASATRVRLQSRAAGRIRPRGAQSLRGGARPRTAWRSQSGRPLSASRGANSRSRRVRLIYGVLIAILVVLIIIFIVGGGGSNKPHQSSAHNGNAGAARSALAAAPTTPTVASTPTVAAKPKVVSRPATKHPVASQGKPCGSLNVGGRTVSVHVLKGNVTCAHARTVLVAFESGQANPHGSGASQYWTFDHWKCVHGGSCTRPGKSIKAS